jgi:hypothetical protein
LNFGDAISSVENIPDYSQMLDSKRPFLQVYGIPTPKGSGKILIMIFGNLALTGLLKTPQLDVYVDASFNCCPKPFLPCLILMIYDQCTSSYIPILYALMTSKCKEAYWHVFNLIMVISKWKIQVHIYCTDCKVALIKEANICLAAQTEESILDVFFTSSRLG